MNIDDYPLLQRVAPERREHFLHKAEQGEPLTENEAAEIGLPQLAGMRLFPRSGGQWTSQQLIQCFPVVNRAAFIKTLLKNQIAANAKTDRATLVKKD